MSFTLSTFTKSLSSIFDQIKKDQAEALNIQIAANFVAGMTAGEKHRSFKSADPEPDDDGLTDEEKAEIALLIALYLGYISEFNTRAQAQILTQVEAMNKAGNSTEEIKKYVDDVLSGKEVIVINNVGKEKKEIYVDKNLKLSEVTKVIENPFYTTVSTYAALLGANAAHAAYEKGKDTYNIKQGLDEWIFAGPADERARPWHIALIGTRYKNGSEQSQYAEQCLAEPRCRHRKVPYYGDSRDTPVEKWQQLKDEAGLYWDDQEKKWSIK